MNPLQRETFWFPFFSEGRGRSTLSRISQNHEFSVISHKLVCNILLIDWYSDCDCKFFPLRFEKMEKSSGKFAHLTLFRNIFIYFPHYLERDYWVVCWTALFSLVHFVIPVQVHILHFVRCCPPTISCARTHSWVMCMHVWIKGTLAHTGINVANCNLLQRLKFNSL